MHKILLAGVLAFSLVAAACGGVTPFRTAPVTTIPLPTTLPSGPTLNVRYGTLTERTLDIDADGRNTTAAVAGMNQFAMDLYSSVGASEEGNVVISPYSVTFALSMVYAGARGDTAAEMAEVLSAGPSLENWQEGINAYDLTLDARTTGSPTTWTAANKVWTAPGLALRDEYLDALTGVYGSPLAEANFLANAEAERKVINQWISENTEQRIPELWPVGSFSPQTVMVLVNAVALDAPWEFPFDPESTRNEEFFLADGATVTVPMMRYDEFLPSGGGEDYQAVEIPYGGGALSMVVIVPTDLPTFENGLTVERIDEVVDSIQEGGIHLRIPKWSARTHLTMNETLSGMGMPTAFSPGSADFSGMVKGPLWLDRVEHEAFIEVDEVGTRAAAATGAAMAGSHGPTVDVNRPFLYLIRDRGAGTILFMGRVTDPTIAP